MKDKNLLLIAVNYTYQLNATQEELQTFLGKCFSETGELLQNQETTDPILEKIEKNKIFNNLE